MRLLLINPPFYRFLRSSNPWLSPGLGYVGTAAHRAGHEVLIINLDRPPVVKIRELPAIIEASGCLKAAALARSHPAWNELAGFLSRWGPDVVGVTVTTPTVLSALSVARVVRENSPGVMLVAGGPHATIRPWDLLVENGFDVVIRGEGESAIVSLLNLLASGAALSPIWEPEPLCDDLDQLARPELNLYAHAPATSLDLGLVVGSRGCSGRCIFCASPVLWQGQLRLRSARGVVNEIVERQRDYGVNHIYFIDDQFNYNLEWAKELCRLVRDNCPGLRWIAEARVIPFDEELARLMVESGCERVKFGLESGSDRILKLMNKGFTVDDVRQAAGIARQAGLEFTLYVLLGMPGETAAESRATVRVVEELEPKYVSIGVVTGHPGTAYAAQFGEATPGTTCHQAVNERVDRAVLERLLGYNKKEGKVRL